MIDQQGAEREAARLLRAAEKVPALRRTRGNAARAAKQWNFSLALVDAAVMRRLNRKYRGKNKPTDVLSFPSPPLFAENGQLGDLVICLPVLERQARELGHDSRGELRVLLVHGLLHLLGFDHEAGEAGAARMKKLESVLLEVAFPAKKTKRKMAGLIRRTGIGVALFFVALPVLAAAPVTPPNEDQAVSELMQQRQQFQQTYENLNRLNPLAASGDLSNKLATLLSRNSVVSSGIDRMIHHPHRMALLFAEIGLMLATVVYRAWRYSRVRHWFRRLWIKLYTAIAFFVLGSVVLPVVILGREYYETLVAVFRMIAK